MVGGRKQNPEVMYESLKIEFVHNKVFSWESLCDRQVRTGFLELPGVIQVCQLQIISTASSLRAVSFNMEITLLMV